MAVCAVILVGVIIGIYNLGTTIAGALHGGGKGGSAAANFSGFYYYEEDRRDRYADYAARHPQLTAEEVVWRVGADIDLPFYTNISEINDVYANPLLVNKYNRLPEDYTPGDIINTSFGHQMTSDTKAAYESMRDAAGKEGFHISAFSAYRSIEYQKGLYNRRLLEKDISEVDSLCARGGHSEHHTGRAVDIVGPGGTTENFAGTPEAEWLKNNASRFGFIVRYTDENSDVTGYQAAPWHVTYVGVNIAEKMRAEGIESLEEYVVKFVNHTPPEQ
jgi:D-alanyl-D-alanine carboxypeptidase